MGTDSPTGTTTTTTPTTTTPTTTTTTATNDATTPADAAVQKTSPQVDTSGMTPEELEARVLTLEAMVHNMTSPTASGGDIVGSDAPRFSDTAQAGLMPEDPDRKKDLGMSGAEGLFTLEEGQEILDYNVRGDKVIVALNDGSKMVADYPG